MYRFVMSLSNMLVTKFAMHLASESQTRFIMNLNGVVCTVLGVYEHERDGYKFPSCWHVTNDACLPHFHSSIEFVYVTEGELKVTLNGVSSLIQKSQLLIVSSYTVHYYETMTSSEAIILIVPLDFIPTYNKMLAQNDFTQNVYQDVDREDSEILHCMEILSENKMNDKKLSMNIIKGYIYVIIGILIENVGLIHNRNDSNRNIAKDILVYLQDNYLSSVSLQQLAKDFGYSTSRFSHIFNSCFGCTIADYVNTLRCRHASGLLIDDSVPIISAAMGSGFNSMRTFYRSFKHCFGVTPSQYRDDYAKMRADGDVAFR